MILRLLARTGAFICGVLLLVLTLVAAEPVRTDSQIDAILRAKLAKSLIGKDGFTFRVKDGVVYWDGSTTIPQHKGGATRMAKSSGARRVVNGIRVAGAKAAVRRPETAKSAVETAKPQTDKTFASPAVANPPAMASPKRATVHWIPAK